MVAYIAETSATAGDDLGKARQAAALTIHASQGAHKGHRGTSRKVYAQFVVQRARAGEITLAPSSVRCPSCSSYRWGC